MVSINSATDESSIFRARGNQSAISCLYADQSQAHDWRRASNSFALINTPTAPIPEIPSVTVNNQNKLCSSDTASKLSHHQLW